MKEVGSKHDKKFLEFIVKMDTNFEDEVKMNTKMDSMSTEMNTKMENKFGEVISKIEEVKKDVNSLNVTTAELTTKMKFVLVGLGFKKE